MKFPVLWLSFVSVWAGTGKVICLAWDLVSRSHITLHFGAKIVKNNKTKNNKETEDVNYVSGISPVLKIRSEAATEHSTICLPCWRPAGTRVFYLKELQNYWEYPVCIRTWRWTYHLHERRNNFRGFARLRSDHPLTKTSLSHFKYSQSARPAETPRMYHGRLLKATPI